MNLFEKVKEVKECNEKANRLTKELKANLLKQFVELPYELKEVEANYEHVYANDSRIVSVYYPILNTPKGFKREDEKFYREYANCVDHEYTLSDEEGRKVTIFEQAIFENYVYKSERAYMSLRFDIVENIEFKIEMLGETYSFKKGFNLKELIKKIISPEDVVSYNYFWSSCTYAEQEEKYNEFLNILGKTKEVPTLKELVNAKETKIQITDSINAIVEARVNRTTDNIWLNGSMYNVWLEKMQAYSIDIKIKPYLNEAIELAEQRFHYEELENEEELKKGKTFDEIVQLLESFQTE